MNSIKLLLILGGFMLGLSAKCRADAFDDHYAAWREYALREGNMTTLEFHHDGADAIKTMGPNAFFRLVDKIKIEPDPVNAQGEFEDVAFHVQYILQKMLGYTTGIWLDETASGGSYHPEMQSENRQFVMSWTPDHFEREAENFPAYWRAYKLKYPVEFVPDPVIDLSMVRFYNLDLYKIIQNGVFSFPFTFQKIRDENRAELLLAWMSPVAKKFDEFGILRDNPKAILQTKEEKIKLIQIWWEEARDTFSELPELQNQLDAVLVAPPFALYSYHSMILDQNATVTGDIGVREKQTDVTIGVPDTEITIHQNVAITGNLYADAIVLQNNAQVTGVVVSNELTTASGVVLTEPRETSVVLPVINPVTDFPAATPGESAISVAHSETQSLVPGSYSALIIESQATVELTTGTYHFQDITLWQSANIITNGSCEVRVAGRFSAGNNSAISPISGAQLDAGNMQFFIGGMNGGTGALDATPKAAEIGNNCAIQARIVAPNGTLELGNGSNVQGVLVAKWLDIGENCVITKQ